MKISDILRWKAANGSAEVFTIAPGDSVRTLLQRLAEHNVGALIAVEDGAVVGVVSERDVVRRIAEQDADVLDQDVGRLMTSSVVTCRSSDTIDSIAETMTERRIRHMPVIDGDELTGIVSIGDVVSHRMRQLEKDRGQLEQYIAG